jgi:hypothetical protein
MKLSIYGSSLFINTAVILFIPSILNFHIKTLKLYNNSRPKVSGMPHTGGVLTRKNVIATKDSPTMAALKNSGMVIVGVCNTSEACM